MDSIQITVGLASYVLQGGGVTGAMRGARVLPASGPGEQIEEPIELVLEGTATAIEASLDSIMQLVDQARAAANGAAASWGYLEVVMAAGGATWRSKISDGWLEYSQGGAGQRARGRIGVVLRLVRENWWEREEMSLPLSNPLASNVTTGLTIQNHQDGSHYNYARIAAASLLGDLPAPARIELNVTTGETGTVWMGLNQSSDPVNLSAVNGSESTGTGSGGTITTTTLNDALYASNGSARRFAWNGATVFGLARWALSAANLGKMAGHPFRPVMRFFSQVNESNIWAWWRVLYAGLSDEVIWEGPGQYLSDQMVVQDFPALYLPPWSVPAGATPPGLLLELAVQAGGAGAHQVDIDDLTLMPLDGWRKYNPVMLQVAGLTINDDSQRDQVYALTWAMQAHAAEGPGFWLQPGKDARLVVLVGQRLLPNIDTSSTIKVLYRPRRRGL